MAVLIPDNTVDVLFNAKKIPEVLDFFFIDKPFHRLLWLRKQLDFSSKQLETFLILQAQSNGGFIQEDGTQSLIFTDPIGNTSYDPKLFMDIFTNTFVEGIFNVNNPDAVLNSLDEKFKIFMKKIQDILNTKLWNRTPVGQTTAETDWNNIENFMSTTTVVGSVTPNSTNRWKANIIDATAITGGSSGDLGDLTTPGNPVYIPTMLDQLIAQIDFKSSVGKCDILVTTSFLFNEIAQLIEANKLGTLLGPNSTGKLLAEMGARHILYKGIPILPEDSMAEAQTTDLDGRIAGFVLGIPNSNKTVIVGGVEAQIDDGEGAGLAYRLNAGAVMRMMPPVRPANSPTTSMQNLTVGNLVSRDRNSMGQITGIKSPKTYSDGTQ